VRWYRYRLRAWAATAGLSILAGGLTAGAVHRASQAAADWGTRREVAVATRALEPGHTIGPGDVERRSLPVVLLPDGALADPVGRVVVAPVVPGEVVPEARVAPEGRRGPAALVPDGHLAVAVPVDGALPPLAPGDPVVVLGVLDPTTMRGTVLAGEATVVAVTDDAVTVAVPVGEATAVSAAALAGPVTLALDPA
jgi:Flp pilus assembly protein CpaB